MNALANLDRLDHYQLAIALDKEECRRSLATFVERAWPHIDPAGYQWGWHHDAIAEHLEAVTAGHIPRLIINIPPRFMKTTMLLLWNAWTWIQAPDPANPRVGPGVQFLCAAYNATKAQTDGIKLRMLFRTEWFKERWGDHVKISPFIDNAETYATTKGGMRINTGVPESMGKGGVIRVIDDPTKADEAESDVTREKKNQNYDEIWSTRSNDPVNGAEVVVMQRLAVNDLTGHLLGKKGARWTHLSLANEYDPTMHCVTSIGWQDPRGCDDDTGEFLHGLRDKKGGGIEVIPGSPLEERIGEPLWPQRFNKEWCRQKEEEVGPYAYAGQFQQIPSPRGGGHVLTEWWRLWEKDIYPAVDLVVVSVDGALTERTANDPSAIQVWGRFNLPEVREPQFILLWAWVGRCLFHELVERIDRACKGDWRGRVGPDVEPVDGGTKADVLLIENKANGRPVAEEVVKLNGKRKWRTLLITPYGDKFGRLISVQHMFSGLRTFNGQYTPGQIWAPDRSWAQSVIEEFAAFPRAGHDDQVDTGTQALFWMRNVGGAMTHEEAEDDHVQRNTFRRRRKRLYPCA